MKPATVVLTCALVGTISAVPGAIEEPGAPVAGPLTVRSARVSLEGTSNIHAYTASTSTVRVTALEVAGSAEGDVLAQVLQPEGLKAFEVVIPVTSLSSPKDGIDKNMHKALKAAEHPEITFRLRRFEPAGAAYQAIGALTVAGVEKEVTLVLQVERQGGGLAVTGATDLLMTDFGVTPPKAMLGMLKTNPKVKIRVELLLSLSSLT
jgi:polyisoprenoid-binding protein YceI